MEQPVVAQCRSFLLQPSVDVVLDELHSHKAQCHCVVCAAEGSARGKGTVCVGHSGAHANGGALPNRGRCAPNRSSCASAATVPRTHGETKSIQL